MAFSPSQGLAHSRNLAQPASGNFPANVAEMAAITTRLAVALNRTTLLINSDQPDGENPSNYYTNSPTNHYARIVHAATLDGRGYAFPYDDIVPTGGADQSGAVYDQLLASLTVVVGGGSA
jgi:Beta-1,3-glucanase